MESIVPVFRVHKRNNSPGHRDDGSQSTGHLISGRQQASAVSLAVLFGVGVIVLGCSLPEGGADPVPAKGSKAATNRLSRETSPYLLSHATNPVDWYPWGPEALEKARKEDKLIFLSIGYSACHWCHV